MSLRASRASRGHWPNGFTPTSTDRYYRRKRRYRRRQGCRGLRLNLPLILPLLSVAIIPVVLGLFYSPWDSARQLATVLYAAAAITDWRSAKPRVRQERGRPGDSGWRPSY